MRQAFFDGDDRRLPDRHSGFRHDAGPFQITSLEFAGEHNGEVTYDLSLESAGELTFTAA